MTKIVDCFPYYDPTGRQVTELRLRMYEHLVDQFVIVESNVTHTGNPAQLGIDNLLTEIGFPLEKVKIVRLNISNNPMIVQDDITNCYDGNHLNKNSVLSRARERMQKDAILSIIDEYDDDTAFLLNDQDEMINPYYFQWILNAVNSNPNSIVKIPLVLLEGRADLRVHNKIDNTPKLWDTPVSVVKKHHLKNVTPTGIRGCTQTIYPTVYITNNGQRIEDMGWHFSWMGGPKERISKLKGFAHYHDTFDFLETKSYNSQETVDLLTNMVLADGNIPPSCNKNEILRFYPRSNLPGVMFTLPRVYEYLLDPSPLPFLFDESKIEFGTQPEVSARFVYNEFVLDNCYEYHREVKNGDVVVDIGANVGMFPLMLKFKSPKHVYCVEPSNELFDVLKRNTNKLEFPITYLKYAIGGTSGEKEISKTDWIYGNHGESTFNTKTFKEFLSDNNINHIDFLKIDCEGGEYDIFTEENYDFIKKNVRYVIGEWHMGGVENGVEKFIKFKDIYLKGNSKYKVFEPYQLKRDISKDVLDNDYVRKYYDWWHPRGEAAQFILYMENDLI